VYKERKRGRPKGCKGKSNCDDDYIPHHSQLSQSSKKANLKLSPTESCVGFNIFLIKLLNN
jgi:hypothetical protein